MMKVMLNLMLKGLFKVKLAMRRMRRMRKKYMSSIRSMRTRLRKKIRMRRIGRRMKRKMMSWRLKTPVVQHCLSCDAAMKACPQGKLDK